MAAIRLFKNNQEPSIVDVIEVNENPVDLTGATVTFNMRPASSNTPKVSAGAVVVQTGVSPNFVNEGMVQYNWVAGDLDTVGDYRAWWHVTYQDSTTQDTPEFDIKVLAHTFTSSDLCTVFDVRQSQNLPAIASTDDDQIQALISEASAQISDAYARQFAPPVDNATYRFPIDNTLRIDLYPFDLRVLRSLVLNPDAGGTTLDINTDVELSPISPQYDVYTSIKVTPWKSIVSPHYIRFGKSYVDVTGDWGFATVPLAVKRACVIAVRSWLRRDTTTYANADFNPAQTQPMPQGTYYLPYASKALLARFVRWPGIV